jgi:hypothetical protein
MIAAQPPSLPIFISAQTVPGADMSSQCPPSVAAIKTDHILPVDGPSHRHSGSENLIRFGRLSKLTDCSMNRGDQIGKLIRPQPMVLDITLDDFGR